MHASALGFGFGLLLSLTLLANAAAADAPFRDGTTWCGNPDAVQSADNPYVKLAEQNVTRAMQYPDVFWYTWGYAAPESKRRGDAKLRDLALAEMDQTTAKLATAPNGYWEILSTLECVRMLQKLPDIPAERIAGWLAQLRPSVQSNFDINTAEKEWMCFAPNALNQSEAVLELASQLYHEPKWDARAHALVRKVATYQEPDGAFRYIRNSGPCQVYYGFDSTFLGRYYELSRDPLARELLVRMAGYSRDVLANGLMEGSSTPWWKHHWGTGGPIHGIEIVAGLSRDPLTRSVAELRLKGGQPYFFSYYSMYCWDPTIPLVPVAPDLCRYDTNIGGPQIRRGAWQVVMPGKAYADTGIGCTVVTGDKPFNYEGYLETANLPVLSAGAVDAYDRPGSLFVAGPEETGTRASLAGPDWIASGWTYQPRPGIFGDPASPPPQGWRLAQVWFADAHGLGGWLSVTCTAKTGALSGPRGYLGLGQEAHLDAAAPTRLTAGQLSLQVWGDGVAALTPEVRTAKEVGWLTHNFAWVTLKNVAERVYEPGETFGYGLSACPSDSAPLEVRDLPVGAALGAQIVRPRGAPVTLLFNPTAAPVTVEATAVAGATIWTSTDHPGAGTSQAWTAGKVSLKPYELAVIVP